MSNQSKNRGTNNKKNGSGNYRPAMYNKQGKQRSVDGEPYTRELTDQNSSKNDRRDKEIADAALKDLRRGSRGPRNSQRNGKLSEGNPPARLMKYSTFTTDAATLPFANPLGTAFSWSDGYKDSGSSPLTYFDTNKYTVPGVMTIAFSPAIGISRDFSSAINRSSIRFYTYLRSNQKASAKYDHQDITMMEVAIDSCYMFHSLMKKIYSVINLFTPANEYYSRAVVKGCNADFDDLRAHLQDFRAYINAFAYSLGQYALPKNIELFNRHQWMCEGLYTDSTSTRAQTYMFVPVLFYKYNNTVSTGSQCVPKFWLQRFDNSKTPTPISNTPYTYAQIKAFGDELLNAISNEEDFAVISGDIYNFYGGDVYKLDYVDENYAILPAYEESVLSMIENATIVGPLSDLTISQNPNVNQGAIVFAPTCVTEANYPNEQTVSTEVYMNFHKDRPSPADVVEASRLIATNSYNSSTKVVGVASCGTELVWGLSIFGYRYGLPGSPSDTKTMFEVPFRVYSNVMCPNTSDEFLEAIANMGYLAQFDWAPQFRIYKAATTSPASASRWLASTWDIDNFDTIPKNYLNNIHLGVLLSLFTTDTNRAE